MVTLKSSTYFLYQVGQEELDKFMILIAQCDKGVPSKGALCW